MDKEIKPIPFKNRIVMVGFGSIGQGVMPLILKHFDVSPDQITVITADDRGVAQARAQGVNHIVSPLTPSNYRQVLGSMLSKGDFLVNVSVNVSSLALTQLCHMKKAFYIDTCIEPWVGFYTNPALSVSDRSNYALREQALALRKNIPRARRLFLAHGANPGLVTHFVKQALVNMALDTGLGEVAPKTQEEWAQLAQSLGVKVIHVAERDTQVSNHPKARGEFVNTWSIDGFYSEGCQPAELGWGSHEKELPSDGAEHKTGCRAAIYLRRPGRSTTVRSWTPLEGPYQGFLITHNEAISLADYFTIYDEEEDELAYRPTCHYAYHPCDAAVLSMHELNGKNGVQQEKTRLMTDEIVSGVDELGVLLMGNAKGVYWYGSRLSIEQARALAPHNNATSLQVTVAILSGMMWALENPRSGIVEPENMDYERVLEIATPYLGEVVGVWGNWTPLKDRGTLFNEDIDPEDPWQFKNICV